MFKKLLHSLYLRYKLATAPKPVKRFLKELKGLSQ